MAVEIRQERLIIRTDGTHAEMCSVAGLKFGDISGGIRFARSVTTLYDIRGFALVIRRHEFCGLKDGGLAVLETAHFKPDLYSSPLC
jgi:hypothetical protein